MIYFMGGSDQRPLATSAFFDATQSPDAWVSAFCAQLPSANGFVLGAGLFLRVAFCNESLAVTHTSTYNVRTTRERKQRRNAPLTDGRVRQVSSADVAANERNAVWHVASAAVHTVANFARQLVVYPTSVTLLTSGFVAPSRPPSNWSALATAFARAQFRSALVDVVAASDAVVARAANDSALFRAALCVHSRCASRDLTPRVRAQRHRRASLGHDRPARRL